MTNISKKLQKNQLLECITSQPDLVVLTENAAIARELKSALLKKSTDNQIHLTQISTLEAWLEKTAQEYANKHKKQLANQQQMLQLWDQIIEKESEDFPELQASNLAPQAHRAWLRLQLWNADIPKLAELESYNPLKLSSWCQKFEAQLRTKQLTQRELVLKEIQLRLTNTRAAEAKPPSLVFIGIGADNQIAPLHLCILQQAFATVEQCLWYGDAINKDNESQNHNKSAAECFQSAFDSPELELEAAAYWAQALIQKDANARIGVLFTEQGDGPKRLVRILKSQGQHDLIRICMPQASLDSGIFNSALKLLEINRLELRRSECLSLIRNPFWGDYPMDTEQRALWETKLCDLEQKQIKTSELINIARSVAIKLDTPREQSLVQRLTRAKELNKLQNIEQSPQQWAELFSAQLQALGWPGSRKLDKGQESELELFIDLMQQMVSLRLIEPSISYSRALQLLTRLAQEAKLPADAPAKGINILNTLESAIGFTHLWLVNSSAEHWPGLVKPDPLIPIQYQLESGMPRCHPDHERDFCIKLFDHLRNNCEQLVFSISQQNADQPTEFSPLLPEYPQLTLDFLDNPEPELKSESKPELKPEPQQAKPNWQWVDCSKAPKLSNTDEPARGGSNIFNLMAASPFLAFAQYRLKAKPFTEAFIGIGPHHRGIIIHACLDRIWGQLKDSSTLKQTSESALTALIDEAINQELLSWQSANFNLGLAYFDELKNSFNQLLSEWLAFEAGRQDFVVLSREEEIETQVGPLTLRLRMDRIDQLSQGGKLLIDYKSGSSSSPADLLSSPPVAAQLPLYAISLEDELAGLCFAQVVSGAARLKGISSGESADPLMPIEDWSALRKTWQKDLIALAEAYAAGDSRVFETPEFFGRRDELASLHRMAEYEDLMNWHAEQ